MRSPTLIVFNYLRSQRASPSSLLFVVTNEYFYGVEYFRFFVSFQLVCMVNKVLFISSFLALCVGCQRQEKKTPPSESPSLPLNNISVTPSYTVTPSYPMMPIFTYSFTPADAYKEGYDNGYEQGIQDRETRQSHGFRYNDANDYDDYFEVRYIAGYEKGYEDGYCKGSYEFEEDDEEFEEDDEW